MSGRARPPWRRSRSVRRQAAVNAAMLIPAALVAALIPDWPFAVRPSAALQAQARPLPPAEAFLADVRENLARSDREQYRYAYKERRSELHTNPFGKLGTDGTLLYDVTPGEEYGIYFRTLVEREGRRLHDEKPDRIDRRDRSGKSTTMDDVVSTLSFTMVRRETAGGRDQIVVEFSPIRDAKPKTRQGKLAKVFAGTAWVDEATREVTRVEATATDGLSYGLGLIARLNKGSRVSLVREPVDGPIWMPTSIHLVGEGRAILIRKLDIDFTIEWFEYRRGLE
jgi:hypothetical protein